MPFLFADSIESVTDWLLMLFIVQTELMLEVCRLWEHQALSAEMECHGTRVCLGVAVRRSPWEVYSEAQIHYSIRTASAPLVSVTLLTLWLYYCTIVACLDLGISNKWAQRQPHRQYFILTDHDRISISSYTKYLYTGRDVRPRAGYDTYVFTSVLFQLSICVG